MTKKYVCHLAGSFALILGLAGCGKVTPEQIEQWKDQGTSTKLIGALGDSRQFIRIEAIAALGELKDPASIAELGSLFSDPDTVIVHKSIEAMANIGSPAIEPYMLKAVAFKTEPARRVAATALGSIQSKNAVDPLTAALNDEFKSVVIAAAVSLGQIGDTKAVGPLSNKLSANSYDVRFACITSLSQIGGDDTIEGLASAMGDTSENIRNVAVESLIVIGKPAVPHALEGLRSEDEFTPASAVAIIKGTGTVPTAGGDYVWFTLASIPADPNAKVDPAVVQALADAEDVIDTLTEALAHPDTTVNAYASQALETIGEPAASTAASAAEQRAGKSAKAWLAGRSEWKGAPSWRLDLWGALTSLNPRFKFNPATAKKLSMLDGDARSLLGAKLFKPSAEYTPLLIAQCATPEDASDKTSALNSQLAEKKLMAQGRIATYPLIAALDDDDISVVSSCAKVLVQIDPEGAREILIEAFAQKLESGVDLARTGFLQVITELNDPAAKPFLLKVRPNDARAIQVFERAYPGVHVSIVPMIEIDSAVQAQPFRMKYLQDGKSNELKVAFRPDADGNWVPTPPLPEQLP